MIAIIDYDAGNLKSVEKALLFLGEEAKITSDAEEILAADKIILAVGQHAELAAFSALEPQRNTIETQHYQTRDPQVFAAGDIVEGDKTVVYAVKTGKEAAEAIHHYLEGACSC